MTVNDPLASFGLDDFDRRTRLGWRAQRELHPQANQGQANLAIHSMARGSGVADPPATAQTGNPGGSRIEGPLRRDHYGFTIVTVQRATVGACEGSVQTRRFDHRPLESERRNGHSFPYLRAGVCWPHFR